MSSAESTGTNCSRLRQFGLYRTIDERTEEFLKLSRKRQIRQGCACAAVSTAITVTIVVSVLIVFEYGFHSDPEPSLQLKHKPNWFSMLNESEVKFDINQQHANFKSSVLLPLLVKALKQNRILEKAIEEYSSNTPNYKDATEYPLERNVFTDARNWLRMPPARMYAFEYKTSPIVLFKSRNIDEFSRTRKIMDSRRVMNYLNRMINDKAAYVTREMNNGETDNTVKKISSTASPKRATQSTTHFARLEKRNKSIAKEDTATQTKELHFNDCKCPSNLKNILQKLLLAVQMLFSIRDKNVIVQPEAKSEGCVSKTSAPNRDSRTFVAGRRTITTKRPPKVTSIHSPLPLNLFETITIPEPSSATKLSEKLGRKIQSTTENIYLDSILNSKMTRKRNDANNNASSIIKLSEILRRTMQSTTEKIDPVSLLNSEMTRKQNDANDNVYETTTFKPYLEVPCYTTTITRTKPMTPVTTEDDTQSVMTTEHFMRRSQNAPIDPPQYVNYDVILLIYEYAIAVESSIVQRVLHTYGNDSGRNGTHDHPVADRLDRSYFGFDQDYYERMPLLVNSMQENHYVDPILEMSFPSKRSRTLKNKNKTTTTTVNYRTTSIRRTSPRPFIFEYRSPTPTPFSKTFGSKSWVESYRNAQRLENLQQVIQYLEKTINAKFGDLYTLPSSTHIAFSGVYVQPSVDTKIQNPKSTSPTLDLLSQSSNKAEKTNHLSDPLFSFKPDNPSDVNLLADGFLRFAPTPTVPKLKTSTVPMFRPIAYRKKQENDEKDVVDLQQGASEFKNIESSTVDKPNSFSVMLNYVPTRTTINTDYKHEDGTSSAINKVYFTTSRPVRVHFKRKSSGPVRRMFPPRPIRRPFINRTSHSQDNLRKSGPSKETTMIVHVNLYPQKIEVKDVANITHNSQEYPTTTTTTTTKESISNQLTPASDVIVTQVEDHHVGSSGVLPVESRTEPLTPPPFVTSIPDYETTVSSTEVYTWSTNPPDMVKFSPEDAKIPDQYRQLRDIELNYNIPMAVNRRTFRDDVTVHNNVEPSTLVIKLKNDERSTTVKSAPQNIVDEESDDTTTVQTYVPQINGHYRSLNVNSRLLNVWLDKENDRKKSLGRMVTGLRQPTYVEIKRNNTYISRENDDHEIEK